MTRTLHLSTGAEIPHDRLEDFSPPAVREEPLARARLLPGAVTGPSLVSEPGSPALRLPRIPERNRSFTAFPHPSVDEFGHIHRSGFLHLAVEPTAALRSSYGQTVASTQVSDK